MLKVSAGSEAPYQQASDPSLQDDRRDAISGLDTRTGQLERDSLPIQFKRIKEDYRVTPNDHVILADAAPVNIRVQLPKAEEMKHHTLIVKKIDASANTVTIEGNYPEQIDGAATLAIATQYLAKQIYSDGLKWWIVGVF